ncbi:MAG: hypothetical protein JO094_00385 [Hyphomicrobiales bacterium]|nr:hypothetical protein [Hyphomicrobiales bacterium]
MVERLDPKTGEIKLIASPTPNSSPYGMAISSKAVPYFCEFGANKLASIEPATLAIREYALPHADSRARSMAITNNDIAWYTDYSRAYLGKFDSVSGNFSESPRRADHNLGPTKSPSPKVPFGTAESGVRPNTIVCFDPVSGGFQTWIIPAGWGAVRNMMPTHEGNLVLAESGVDRVALVEIK